AVAPDTGAHYDGGVHTIDLSVLRPMVAHPGNPDEGIPSDPTNGAWIDEIGDVPIDIAYGGSCTAGKIDDLVFYHQVVKEAVGARLRLAPGGRLPIPCGSGGGAALPGGKGPAPQKRRAHPRNPHPRPNPTAPSPFKKDKRK